MVESRTYLPLFKNVGATAGESKIVRPSASVIERKRAIEALLKGDAELHARYRAVRAFSRSVRSSEYHLTNACNIRCKGCWFFEYEHDTATKEVRSLDLLRQFLDGERRRHVNYALLIGGEPTLVVDRIAAFVQAMTWVTVSTNGLNRLPMEGFENVMIAITLFGGGKLDDELRGVKPNGKRFTGLFDKALENYRDDPRAGFTYAITPDGIDYIEDTVHKIRENGNRVTFNYYSAYATDDPFRKEGEQRLLEEALRVKRLYPETIVSHEYYIHALIHGGTEWGSFGYDVCPNVSMSHPGNTERLTNGNPTIPFFNSYAADLKTVNLCCTSGHCEGCRDSQAMYIWLLMNPHHFVSSLAAMRTWVEVAESYWEQYYWSPYHPRFRDGKGQVAPSAASTS